tara:strand:+ start:51 stop:194 length:144 start_codon:yes stop_codon:yes gene_type:complete
MDVDNYGLYLTNPKANNPRIVLELLKYGIFTAAQSLPMVEWLNQQFK